MLRERPLLIPFMTLSAGLCTSEALNLLLPLTAVGAVFGCLVLAAFHRNRWPFFVCTACFFYVFGLYALTPWESLSRSTTSILQFASRTPVVVEGIVRSRPEAKSTGGSFVLKVQNVLHADKVTPVDGSVLVYVREGEPSVMRGDRIRLATRLAAPKLLGLPGEFDFPRFLRFQQVAATGQVNAPGDIVLIRGAAEDSLLRRMDQLAMRLSAFIRASVPDPSISSVLTALLVGDQRRIPQQLADAYTRAGVNHILSISGFHIGIIVVFIMQISLLVATRSEWLALRLNLRRSALLLSLPGMVFYLGLTGAAPATARAVIMLLVLVLSLYAERETDPVDALLAAATVLVIIHPPSLFDISFQLSFLALWGIIIALPPVMERTASCTPLMRSLVQFTATSCAACCVTAIPVLLNFQQASLNGILSNFVIVPILGYGAVLIGFCALPFALLLPPVAHWLLWGAGVLVNLSNGLIAMFARLPLLSFPGISGLDMFALLAVMVCVTFAARKRHKLLGSLILSIFAVAAHAWVSPSRADNRLHVSMLSVGQAESLLVRLPKGRTMLVDGGGYLHENGRDFGERVLKPALFHLGIDRIDYLVMTHSHPDHIGGFPYIARQLEVGEFWEPAQGGSGPGYDSVRTSLRLHNVPIHKLAAGDVISLPGGVELRILSPRRIPLVQKRNDDEMAMNEESLVFKLHFGKTSMLFMADAGFPAEDRILAGGADVAADILKVGHHGSRFSTSEAFLSKVSPRIALISAGVNNFGLPAPRTTELLRKKGIRIYRTDQDGTIELHSDGANWKVSTPYRPE